jgi:Double zinc ribbon
MLPLAYFGIESSGLNLVVDLLILFVVVLYFSSIYWTYADARRRIQDPMLVGCAFVASLFPFVGPIIYAVVRPPEYLDDVRERELETQAAQARISQLEQSLCPYCSYRVESDFIRCPSCLRKLKEPCASCSRPLDQTWTICPYCEADVPGLAPTRSRRRRGSDRLADAVGAATLESDIHDLDAQPTRRAEDSPSSESPPPTIASESARGSESTLASDPAIAPRRSSHVGRSSRPRPSS